MAPLVTPRAFFHFGMHFQSMASLGRKFWSEPFILVQTPPWLHWISGSPPRLASVRLGWLHSWKPEITGHQLFPILRENIKPTKQEQKVMFLCGSHQLLKTVVFTQEKLEKVACSFPTIRQGPQPLRLQHRPSVRVPEKQIFCIHLSSLQHQASWTMSVPQEKRKKWRTLYF